MINNFFKETVLNESANCSNLFEDLKFFCNYFEYLDNFKLLGFTDDRGMNFPKSIYNNKKDNFYVFNLGFTQKYYYLDKHVVADFYKKRTSTSVFDMCINLDTNAVSYLKKVFVNPHNVYIPDHLQNMFYYLNNNNLNFSCFPYNVENSLYISERKEDIFNTLKSFQYFKNFDYINFLKYKTCRYNATENSIIHETNCQMKSLASPIFQDMALSFYKTKNIIHAIILKTIIIEYKYSKKSADNKFKMLLEFVNYELGIIFERELSICMHYFKHNEIAMDFFSKAQNNKAIDKIFKDIDGMAWDLSHMRISEFETKLILLNNIDLSINWFLTFDKKLRNVLQLCPVKKLVLWNDDVYVFYSDELLQSLDYFKELLINEDIKAIRMNTFNNLNVINLIEKLKNELSETYN